jgi:hypothetical protein
MLRAAEAELVGDGKPFGGAFQAMTGFDQSELFKTKLWIS